MSSLELKANIGVLAALECLQMMKDKSGYDANYIMDAILKDPEGNAANYFKTLVAAAISEVPKLLGESS